MKVSKLYISEKNSQLVFTLNGRKINIAEWVAHIEHIQALYRANEKLEADLDTLVTRLQKVPDNRFLWVLTWLPLRFDDLNGVIAWYYLIEIVLLLKEKVTIDKVVLSTHFPAKIAAFVQQKTQIITTSSSYVKTFCYHFLKSHLSPFRGVLSIGKTYFRAKEITPDAIWTCTGNDFYKHRYKNLLFFCDSQRIAAFCADFTSEVTRKPENIISLNFAAYLKYTDFIEAMSRAFSLRKTIRAISPTTLVGVYCREQSLFQIGIMILREILVDRAMRHAKPKAILFATANTYPPARLMSRLAKSHDISMVIVACRPMFTDLRPEERACQVDLQGVDGAVIGDYYLVWDRFSKNTLASQGLDPERIFISQLNHREIVASEKVIISSALLLLFTHDKNMNDDFIDALNGVGTRMKMDIHIRLHPLCPLSDMQKERLATAVGKYQDLSATPMFNVQWQDVLAITINSTAAVEACSLGCGVIWLPYLNDRSIIFHPVMAILGKAFYTKRDFHAYLLGEASQQVSRQALIQACQQSYLQHFYAEDETSTFLKKLPL